MLKNPAAEDRRRSRPELESLLAANGVRVTGGAFRCPFHDDARPSASIKQGEDGAWRMHCFAGSCGFRGDVYDVEARLRGVSVADILKERGGSSRPAEKPPAAAAAPAGAPTSSGAPPEHGTQETKKPIVYKTVDDLNAAAVAIVNWKLRRAGKPEICTLAHKTQTNLYVDPVTKAIDLVTIRLDVPEWGKEFLQASPCEGGFWFQRPKGKLQPIFNRTRILGADTVIVVEGEKAARALTEVLPPDVAATTSPGGARAGAAAEADWSPLTGKAIYLWPDNDPPDPKTHARAGIEHMKAVRLEIERLPDTTNLRWIDPDKLGLPPKGDAADLLAALAGRPTVEKVDAIDVVLTGSKPINPSSDLWQEIEDTIDGKIYAVPWPWPLFANFTQALLPDSQVVICGPGGVAKSWWAAQACLYWHANGYRCGYLAVEKTPTWHKSRFLAVLSNNFDVTTLEWRKKNPDKIRQLYNEHRDALDSFSPWLEVRNTAQTTYRDALEWAERMCSRGCRVLVIDPVTALVGERESFVEDLSFVFAIRPILQRYKASVVMITHPRKAAKTINAKTAPLDDLAGGAAYSRFTDTVVWILRHEPKVSEVNKIMAGQKVRDSVRHNRTVRLSKTRDGAGDGCDLAFWFGGQSPEFRELGWIRPDGAPAETGVAGTPGSQSAEDIPL